MRFPLAVISPALLASFAGAAAAADPPPERIPVAKLARAPVVDGSLAEWQGQPWTSVRVKPAATAAERRKFGLDDADGNRVGTIDVQLKAGVFGDAIYFAVRWADDTADADYRPWEWNGERYVRSERFDDTFAIRFDWKGGFDRSMLVDANYEVDVWLWSAGRSNPSGYAEDMRHAVSTRESDEGKAAEYTLPHGRTIYIRKLRDEGTPPPYKYINAPAKFEGNRVPSVVPLAGISGSVADVRAVGVWSAGHWNVEFARKLDTSHGDDRSFAAGQRVIGQIAVSNRAEKENKSVSEPFVFEVPSAR
jgi:ethylbenzene dehydrogenase